MGDSGKRYSSRTRSRSPLKSTLHTSVSLPHSTLSTLTSSAQAVSVTHPSRPPITVVFGCHAELSYNISGDAEKAESGFGFFTTTGYGTKFTSGIYNRDTQRLYNSPLETILRKVNGSGNVTAESIQNAICETRTDPRLSSQLNSRRPIDASCKNLYHPPYRPYHDMVLFLHGEYFFDREGVFYINDEGLIVSANELFGLENVTQEVHPVEGSVEHSESDIELVKNIVQNEKRELSSLQTNLKTLDDMLDKYNTELAGLDVTQDEKISELQSKKTTLKRNIKILERTISQKRKQIRMFETRVFNKPVVTSSIRYDDANRARFGNEIKFSQLCTIAGEGGFFVPGYDYFVVLGCRIPPPGITASSVSLGRPPGVNSQGGGVNKSIIIPTHKHNIRKKSRISRKYKHVRHIKKRKVTRRIRYKKIYKNRTRRYKK